MYRLEFTPRAAKGLAELPREWQVRVAARLEILRENPRGPGAARMAGAEGIYRVRVGNYRVVYRVYDRVLMILVVLVGHRREIYRRL